MNGVTVKIKKLRDDAKIPKPATVGSGCVDLCYCGDETLYVKHRETTYIPTGLAIELPEGYILDIRPRSGLSENVYMINAPGTIDSDYRGEIIVMMRRRSQKNWVIFNPGDRIAQAKVSLSPKITFIETNELSETGRNYGGFGSTGR